MSIIDRLNLLVRSELSGLSSKGEKYRSTMNEVDTSLRGAKRQQIELRVSEKNLIAQIREVREKAEKWEERAILALKSGEEDLAKDALIVKNKTLIEADELRDALQEVRHEIRDLQSALEALEMKIDGSKLRKNNSEARRTHSEKNWDAELERRRGKKSVSLSKATRNFEPIGTPPDTDGSLFDTRKSFSEFDRMSQKIGKMEASLDAMDEISGEDWFDPRRRELESIFSKMEKKKKTTGDLADLKKKFDS